MAFQENFLDDEENQNPGGSTIITGNGQGVASNAPSATGSGYTNLQSYLGTNQGAGKQIADAITGSTQQKMADDKSAIADWKETAKKEADASTKQDAWSNVINTGTKQQVGALGNNDAFSAWQQQAAYTGPQNAQNSSGYSDVYKNVQNTQNAISGLGDYNGQRAALNQTYGQQGNYGTGFAGLDSLALRGDESGQQALQNFQNQAAGYGDIFEQAVNDVNSYLGGAEARGQQNQAAVTDAAKQRYSSLNNGVSSEAQKAAAAQKAALQAQLQSTINNTRNNSIIGAITTDPFISQNSNYNPYAAASADDISALNALAGLTGANPVVSGGDANAYSADEAGLANTISQLKRILGISEGGELGPLGKTAKEAKDDAFSSIYG